MTERVYKRDSELSLGNSGGSGYDASLATGFYAAGLLLGGDGLAGRRAE